MASPSSSERRRSSIFSLLFGGSKTSSAVWEVKSDEDLGLDVVGPKKASKEEFRRRPRTLERTQDLARTEAFGSQVSVLSAKSAGSAYSLSTAGHGSVHSMPLERPRPRTLDSLPPISPVAVGSSPSVSSSERGAKKPASHIQLVPKRLLPPEALTPIQGEEMRRLERDLQVQDRRLRGQSSNSGEDASASSGKIRIQFVPKSALATAAVNTPAIAIPSQEDTVVCEMTLPPIVQRDLKHKTRVNRSLTAVTEEAIPSDIHSDIEEEDFEESDSDVDVKRSESALSDNNHEQKV